jgi:peptidoglycan hydrolase CwlO-like protein
MKDTMELLDYLITNEAESIEKMLHISKVDKRKILRLQNKLKALEKDIRKHKQSVKEYRNYLRSMSESIHTRTKLNPARKRHPDMAPEITQIKSVGKLEK